MHYGLFTDHNANSVLAKRTCEEKQFLTNKELAPIKIPNQLQVFSLYQMFLDLHNLHKSSHILCYI